MAWITEVMAPSCSVTKSLLERGLLYSCGKSSQCFVGNWLAVVALSPARWREEFGAWRANLNLLKLWLKNRPNVLGLLQRSHLCRGLSASISRYLWLADVGPACGRRPGLQREMSALLSGFEEGVLSWTRHLWGTIYQHLQLSSFTGCGMLPSALLWAFLLLRRVQTLSLT